MILPFELLNSNSKIWIFQSERTLTNTELEFVGTQLEQFLSSWSSHQNEILSGFTFKHQRFIFVAVDQKSTAASGCSIDKLVHFIQQLGETLKLNLMDKNIAFVKDEMIETVNISQIKYLINFGAINEDTLIFNNSITSKNEIAANWLLKASETWTAKYFKKELA